MGHGACPLGASTLPNMGKHVTPLGHVCCTDVAHLSPIWQTPFGLKQNPCLGLCFLDKNLDKPKADYSVYDFCQSHQPPLVLKPILTFPKGRNKLPCFVKDFFSQWHQPPPSLPRRGGTVTLLLNSVNLFSPHLASPEGEGQILCFVKDCWMQVTLVNDKSPIIRLLWVIIKLPWVIIKLPWVIIR